MSQTKKRSGNLDFMKFLFSLLIILFHGKNCATTEAYIFPGGSIAVEFFFVVSGLLMARAACTYKEQDNLGKDTFLFIKHKFCGLMPNYYVAFVMAFLVTHRHVTSLSALLRDLVDSVWELGLVISVGLRKSGGICNGPVWYLSAMLFAMFIIWPIMRKFKDTFFYLIAPVASLFLMGMTFRNWIHFGGASNWLGFIFKGTVRAFMGLLLGCIAYKIAEALKQQKLTVLTRFLLSAVELIGYAGIFVISYYKGRSRLDWLELLILAICITITYSNVSILADWFTHPIFNWLGVFSYSLYLGHGYWSNCMVELFPNLTYWERMPYYLLITLLSGLSIHYLSTWLRAFWKAKGAQIKRLFVAEN